MQEFMCAEAIGWLQVFPSITPYFIYQFSDPSTEEQAASHFYSCASHTMMDCNLQK